MRRGETINGYEILKDSIPAGGRGEISFAKKGDNEYFIKVFLSPKFPVDGSPGSPRTIAEKRERCKQFEQHHKQLNEKIATKCALGGNLVYAIDFFRSGTCYYKINEKIDVSSIKAKDVAKLPQDKILVILKTVSHSLKILHDLDIVHGDLKPDNILIKKTETGGYTTKLIDFDDSYFSKNPPDYTEVVGTPDYYSPELLEYIKDTGKCNKTDLTIKSDIFTLGVIFTEYLCGQKPSVSERYKSVAESVADENIIKIESLPNKIGNLLNAMLQKDKEKRPSISEVFSILKETDILDGIIKKTDENKPVIKTPPIKIAKNLTDDKGKTCSTPRTTKILISSNLRTE
ncbi:MAG: protein kinase [Rickettsiales bacterium]|jgi:serine/threonine protein kinase|nr:protein kinase [Rickettsiales bacterium]